jgi:predicted GH43/DUF377 family glycosyl hydrolase
MISINDNRMQKYLTPYRYGRPLLTGSGKEGAFDEMAVDIPFVFSHGGKYWMMYVGYDGKGYQTAFATSGDLLNWEHSHIALERLCGSGRWDEVGAAGTWLIKEKDDFNITPTLKRVDGKYWMVYHSYPQAGYETGPAEIGLAYCENEDLTDWKRLDAPVFSWKEGEPWERGGLYKACIIQKDGLWHMYYNAKDLSSPWVEQTGLAISSDLLHWSRHRKNPMLRVSPGSWDGRFLSDPCVMRDGDLWLNFFFGYSSGHAMEGLALSEDAVNWRKVSEPIITSGEPGSLDEGHAHKASIFVEGGRVYHFYCATRPYRPGDRAKFWQEFRTITVACSESFEKLQKEGAENGK